MLDDGNYDAFVVDAQETDDDALRLELAITGGTHKGDVVAVRASGLDRDAVDLIGLPVELFVERGMPRVVLE